MGGVALAILGGLMVGLPPTWWRRSSKGWRYGFTWKQKPPGTVLSPPRNPVAFSATPDGQVLLSFRW